MFQSYNNLYIVDEFKSLDKGRKETYQATLLKNEKFTGLKTTDILIVCSTRPVESKFNPKSIKEPRRFFWAA